MLYLILFSYLLSTMEDGYFKNLTTKKVAMQMKKQLMVYR